MSTLAWIIASGLLGGVVSVAAAALVAFQARPTAIPMLVSYSVGALLGAAFLGVLPHAFEEVGSPTALGTSVLAGLMFFFVLEKLVLWRHHHAPQWGEEPRAAAEALPDSGHAHHHHSRSGTMIMVGDTFHNFVDGVLIAAAFMADFHLGLVTALAILAHEVPSEVGDFLVLLHSGYTRRQALLVNLVSSAAMVVGGLVGYVALQAVEGWIPSLLGFVAASMIYVAVADLIPGLHKRIDLRTTLQQVTLIVLGIGTIAAVRTLIDHTH
jgi:zinc and cadmium transporter